MYFRKTGLQSSLNQNSRMGVVKKMSKHRDVETNKHVGLCQTPKHPNKATRQRNRGVVRERRGDNIWVKARQGPIFSWDHSTSHKPGTSSEPQSTKAPRQRKLITTLKRIGGAVGHGQPHIAGLCHRSHSCV